MYAERPINSRLNVWDPGVSSVTVNRDIGSERNCRRNLRIRRVTVNFVTGSEVNTVLSGSLGPMIQTIDTRRFELIDIDEIIHTQIML